MGVEAINRLVHLPVTIDPKASSVLWWQLLGCEEHSHDKDCAAGALATTDLHQS